MHLSAVSMKAGSMTTSNLLASTSRRATWNKTIMINEYVCLLMYTRWNEGGTLVGINSGWINQWYFETYQNWSCQTLFGSCQAWVNKLTHGFEASGFTALFIKDPVNTLLHQAWVNVDEPRGLAEGLDHESREPHRALAIGRRCVAFRRTPDRVWPVRVPVVVVLSLVADLHVLSGLQLDDMKQCHELWPIGGKFEW